MTSNLTLPDNKEAIKTAPLSVLLKEGTTSTHDSLDQRIMRADPFGDIERYKQFLKVQYSFHWLTAGLFGKQDVEQWIPQLSECCRLEQVTKDCLDLGVEQSELDALTESLQQLETDNAAALGWLYTIEGSNIGAAFLFKFAKKLGLDETRGASHLAGSPEGRGRHWRNFKECLDSIPLNDQEREQAQSAATAAFTFVRERVEMYLP